MSFYCPNSLFDPNRLSTVKSVGLDQLRSTGKLWSLILGGELNARHISWLNSYIKNDGQKLHRWLITFPASHSSLNFRKITSLLDDILDEVYYKNAQWRRLYRNKYSPLYFFLKNEIHDLNISMLENILTAYPKSN